MGLPNRAPACGTLTVVNCGELVTLAGPPRARVGTEMRRLGIVPNGGMRIRDGRITVIGPSHQIEAQISSSDVVVDAGGRTVLPGFVDAHTHTVFAGNRADEFEMRAEGTTYAGIAAQGGGIRATVRRTREASEYELLYAARRYREWFLGGGTTTVEAKSGYGLSVDSEMKLLRVIAGLEAEGKLRYVATFLGAHEVPDEFRGHSDEYLEMVTGEMLPRVAAGRLAEYCDVFCESFVFPAQKARGVLRKARELGLGLRLHADQFSADEGARLAAEVGAATADHLECTTESGMAALLAAGVQPVLLPASVYHLGSTRYAAARRMIEMGLPVVLATDFNPGSSPTASMPLVLSLACTQMKMTPAEAITAATVNAAASLGRMHEIGSLEPGKSADFAIHDAGDYRELPYFFGRETAKAVWVRGVQVYGVIAG